jgi:uncharacterized protein YoaH (UPF0181 family)
MREDRKRKTIEKIEALLLEGLASGKSVEVNRTFWKKKRAALLSTARKHK